MYVYRYIERYIYTDLKFFTERINPVLPIVASHSTSVGRALSVWMSTMWKDLAAAACKMTLFISPVSSLWL